MKLVMPARMSQGGDIWGSSSVGELAANSVGEVRWGSKHLTYGVADSLTRGRGPTWRVQASMTAAVATAGEAGSRK